jgi:hypothetical protein
MEGFGGETWEKNTTWIILKCIFRMWDEGWTGLIWLRIWTGGGLL